MNKKEIERHLKRVKKDFFDQFDILSKDGGYLPTVFNDDTFITGGCIVSLLKNTDVNDYDIYFKSVEKLDNFVNEILYSLKEDIKFENGKYTGYQEFGSLEKYYEDGGKYGVICITDNSITFKNKIQIITRFYGQPYCVHQNFDFVHCINYYDKDKLTLNTDALESILTNELKYVGSKFPVSSVLRLLKLTRQGWSVGESELCKIIKQLHDLDLYNNDEYKKLSNETLKDRS